MKLVELGRVARPHGVLGEVRVQLHFAEGDTLEHVRAVVLTSDRAEPVTLRVLSVRPVAKGVLLRLEGVTDRDAAERLRGRSVCVPREELPAAEPGEYYLCDLIGARVVAPSGDVGEVIEIRVHPSVDCMVIRTPDGRTVEQAIVDAWIESVDVERRLVTLTSSDGLI